MLVGVLPEGGLALPGLTVSISVIGSLLCSKHRTIVVI